VVQQPSVADLVKRYQEYIPPQGLQELARTALAPNYNNAMSESEQEYGNKAAGSKPVRSKRHNPVARKTSISDFEQSYAANVAPRNLTQKGRPPSAWQGRTFRRLGMTTPSMESLRPPRIVSPERQASSFVAEGTTEASDATSPSGSRSTAVTFKTPKGKMPNRFSKDRLVSGGSRPNTAGGSKPPLRRPPPVTGNKVGTITKQFEKIGRENDRMQKRYSVIRGRRPRPVATARAKVQVLDSVKDAIKDESESDASSEADDEGEEDEESRKPVEEQTIDQDVAPATEAVAEGEPTEDTPPIEVKPQELPPNSEVAAPAPTPVVPTTFQEAIPPSVPPSPFLALASIPGLRHHSSEVDLGERHSILRALSGFLGQQTFHRSRDHDVDDPMADPEHIFRDSSMVVRTDEPTSIIALALKYVV
jgi:1-phosphatidylinositol-3-phosphate 5-kinase